MYTQNIDVNLFPGGFPPRISVSQYDDGLTQAVCTIYLDNVNTTLPAGTTAVFAGTKPSKLGFSVNCTVDVDDGTVTVPIVATMTEEDGIIPCELVLTASGDRIGTANMILAVEKSPHPVGTTDGDAASAQTLVEQAEAAVLAAQTAAATVNPTIVTKSVGIDSLAADAQKIYAYSVPVTALVLTPAADGITSVFFAAAASGCVLTVPDSVLIPPGLTVTAGTGTNAITLPGGLKYEVNIFEDHMLLEAWE